MPIDPPYVVGEGVHTFRVRAIDPMGNVDESPAEYTWRVNFPPNTTITDKPSATTAGTSATFAFTSSDANSGFQCRLDNGAWTACNSGSVTYPTVGIGGHNFAVRAVDEYGAVDDTPATWVWTVTDAIAPDTDITGAQTGSMIISFTGTDNHSATGALTFQCRLDAGAWAACTSPKTYTDAELTVGPHTFYVRAIDEAGNIDASPDVHTWTTADTIAPNTTIGVKPADPTLSTTATFSFSGTDNHSAALTYQCRLDSTSAADWVTCTSQKTYFGLVPGAHTFDVRATDAAGNVDASPASYTWTVNPGDTTAPDTVLTRQPSLTTTDPNATFEFTATEAGSTFECKLDTGAWAACTTPKTYTGLTVATHTFQVRAIDAALNQDPSPASYTWTVQSPAPPADCGPPQTLSANADAWIDQGGPQANKGSDSILKVNTKGGSNMRALVRFLLPGLPAGCKVEAAALRLYAASAKDGRTIQAIRIDEPWSESAVTWATAPPTIGAAATTSSGSTSGYREWSVAEQVEAMYDTGEHNGFLVRDANEDQDSEQQYHSREKGSNLPELVLTFAPAAATPPPPTGDTTPPDTSITEGPSSSTTSTSAQFRFQADEAGTTFECRLDSQSPTAFAACTSPRAYSGLTPGSHLFEVRAVDAAGNKDQSPALHTWTITAQTNDTTPPETTLGNKPPASTADRTATFTFSSNETGSTFECKLDSAAFAPCTTPVTILGLGYGAHTFQVRAKDTAGNTDLSPALHSWTVTQPNCGPQLTVGASQDAWIEQGAPANNKGSDSTLKVTSKSGSATRALLQFNLPSIPAGCILDTATLRLYAGGYKDGRTIQALSVNGSWSEGGVTWSNQPATTGTAATVASGAGWREWNVAALIQGMYTGPNHGFLIRDANEANDAEQQFHAREKGSDTPQLVVRFKAAP